MDVIDTAFHDISWNDGMLSLSQCFELFPVLLLPFDPLPRGYGIVVSLLSPAYFELPLMGVCVRVLSLPFCGNFDLLPAGGYARLLTKFSVLLLQRLMSLLQMWYWIKG